MVTVFMSKLRIFGRSAILLLSILCMMYSGGLAKLSILSDSGISYIDPTGKVIINLKGYSDATSFSEGLAGIRTKNGKYGFIDKGGNIVIKPEFFQARSFSDGLAAVKLHEKLYSIPNDHDVWGYVDASGGVIFQGAYDAIYNFSEGIAIARKLGELFFINKSGKILASFDTKDIRLEYAGNQKFSDGLIVACRVGLEKCGFLDKTGKFVIAPKFSNAANFSEGLARVSVVRDDREFVGFINKKGDFVIPPKFDVDFDFSRRSADFSEGLANMIEIPSPMDKDLSTIYLNKSGEIVLRTINLRSEPFHDGLAVVYDSESRKYGYVNKEGDAVIPVKYTSAANFSEGVAVVRASDTGLFSP